jgi:hypothetical protein
VGKIMLVNASIVGEDVQWRRTKVTNHFARYCKSVPSEAQESFKRHKSNENNKSVSVLSVSDVTPSQSASNVGSSATSTMSMSASHHLSATMGRWIDSVNNDSKNKLDSSIAKFYYRTGIPFNVADCKEWKNMWRLARPAYSPPSSKKLRTSL